MCAPFPIKVYMAEPTAFHASHKCSLDLWLGLARCKRHGTQHHGTKGSNWAQLGREEAAAQKLYNVDLHAHILNTGCAACAHKLLS